MAIIRRPAIEVKQGRYKLYLTSFTAKDFRTDGFYAVDRLDIGADEGYQRNLHEPRVKSFAKDIAQASRDIREAAPNHQMGSCFYPTSAFLTTEGEVDYDEEAREISFNTDDKGICPFNIVDGQHRVTALRRASDKNTALDEFPMPVTLATNLKEVEQMLQFLIVNSRQKKVEAGVEQYIYARLCDMDEFKPMPFLPRWVQSKMESGLYRESFDIVKFLNNEKTSPWRGKIVMADDDPKKKGIKQAAFVKNLKNCIFSKNNDLPNDDIRYTSNFLLNYWTALTEFMSRDNPIEHDSNIFRTNGLHFFHDICHLFVKECLDNDDRTVSTIRGYFEKVNDFALKGKEEEEAVNAKFSKISKQIVPAISGDVVKLMASENWKRGGEFGKLNQGGIKDKVNNYEIIFNRAFYNSPF